MLTTKDKSKIWSLIEKYDCSIKHNSLVESLSNILKGQDIINNLISISPFLDLNQIERDDISILDAVFASKLEEVNF